MRVNQFQSPAAVTLNYGYYSDSRLYQVIAPNNHLYDRYFDYNNPIGSMDYTSANGDTTANQYYLTMSHDYLGNQTSRGGRYWWMAMGTTFSNSTQFTNNKIISGSDSGSVTTSFDSEGNTLGILQGSTQTLGPDKFDVAGRIVAEVDPAIIHFYDGDGNLLKGGGGYHLYSKVLGKELSIISSTGTKTETSVFGNGQLLARQEVYSNGSTDVKFVHRDPHNSIDYSGNETQWVDAQGTTGKAATSTYISQYQAGMFGHPDPSTYITNTGQFYPGGGGNQKPGQSTVCYEGYVKVSCSSLNNSIRMGGIVWMRVSSQSLTGYDEESSNLLSSANISATSRNGKPTGGSSFSKRKFVIPGDPNTVEIFDENGNSVSWEGAGKDSFGYEYSLNNGGGGEISSSAIQHIQHPPPPPYAKPGTTQDLLDSVYNDKALLESINKCLRKLLKKNFKKIGDMTRANAPAISGSYPRKYLASLTREPNTLATWVPMTVDGKGTFGTILISKEDFDNPAYWSDKNDYLAGRSVVKNAMVHEVGNYASFKASGGTSYKLFGVPNAADDDSGYALQACVFNEPIQMKKKK